MDALEVKKAAFLLPNKLCKWQQKTTVDSPAKPVGEILERKGLERPH